MTLGLDPALRHGVMVQGHWDFSGKTPELVSSNVIAEWSTPRRQRGALHKDATIDEIQGFCNWITGQLAATRITGVPIGVDWHPMSIFWGDRKAGVKLTYMMGYLARSLETLGCPVVFLDPGEVRKAFGLPPSTPKESIWDQVSFFPGSANSDERDALILSYLVAEALRTD